MNRLIAQLIVKKLVESKPVKLRMNRYKGLSDKTFSALCSVLPETFEAASKISFVYGDIMKNGQRIAQLKVSTKDSVVLFETSLITLYPVRRK